VVGSVTNVEVLSLETKICSSFIVSFSGPKRGIGHVE
jgi:hypothetical protein